jgi:hypothetical protein
MLLDYLGRSTRVNLLRRFRSLLGVLASRGDFEASITQELRFHLEQYTAELVRSGVSPAEAARRARLDAIDRAQQGASRPQGAECERLARGERSACRDHIAYANRRIARVHCRGPETFACSQPWAPIACR